MTTRTFIATIAALIAIVVAALALGLHVGWSTLRHHDLPVDDGSYTWQDDDYIVELWSRRSA